MAQFKYTRSNVVRFTLGDTDYCLEKGGTYELPENEQYIKSLEATEQIERVVNSPVVKSEEPAVSKAPEKKPASKEKEKIGPESSSINSNDNETKLS